MESLSKNCEMVRFDEKLLKWSLKNDRLRCEAWHKDFGPKNVPCGDYCGKTITIGDEVVVARNKKGHIVRIYCSALCQRQYLLRMGALG